MISGVLGNVINIFFLVRNKCWCLVGEVGDMLEVEKGRVGRNVGKRDVVFYIFERLFVSRLRVLWEFVEN